MQVIHGIQLLGQLWAIFAMSKLVKVAAEVEVILELNWQQFLYYQRLLEINEM